MSHRTPRIAGLLLAAGVVMSSISPLAAQPGGGPGSWGPGMMMGPGMMGRGGMWGGGMCSPQAAGLAQWRIASIERAVRPTDAQKSKFDELRAASAKAAEIITAACPRDYPSSPVARLEVAEKRMTAMLEAVKTVRPKFEDFYASLTSEQQARLNSAGPRQWGWRGWRWRE
jgi:Spy/CpxP family protein refolding chaperone